MCHVVGSSGINKAARTRWPLQFRESESLEKTAKKMETQLCWMKVTLEVFIPRQKLGLYSLELLILGRRLTLQSTLSELVSR